MSEENSLCGPMPKMRRWHSPDTGLDMPAWIYGFCRRIALSKVDPERGSPEMKWIPFLIALIHNA
jgi:hypothetical protein